MKINFENNFFNVEPPSSADIFKKIEENWIKNINRLPYLGTFEKFMFFKK